MDGEYEYERFFAALNFTGLPLLTYKHQKRRRDHWGLFPYCTAAAAAYYLTIQVICMYPI